MYRKTPNFRSQGHQSWDCNIINKLSRDLHFSATLGQHFLLPVFKFIFKTCVQPQTLTSQQPEAIYWKVRRWFLAQTQAWARGLWNMYGDLLRLQPVDRWMESFVNNSKVNKEEVWLGYFLCSKFDLRWLTSNLLPWKLEGRKKDCFFTANILLIFSSMLPEPWVVGVGN